MEIVFRNRFGPLMYFIIKQVSLAPLMNTIDFER